MRVPARDLGPRLPDLLRRVRAGETVTITEGEAPVARLVGIDARERRLGLLEGRWTVPDAAFSDAADGDAADVLEA